MRSMRVYELANQHGIEAAPLVDRARALGIVVRSASGALTGPQAERLTASLAADPLPPAAPSPPLLDDFDESDDLRYDSLWTAAQAGMVLGVGAATVRQWAARGYLQPAGRQGRANLYARVDAERVNRETKQRANRPPLLGQTRPRGKDLDKLATGPQAARLAGVAGSTIRMWVARGHLTPAVGGPRPLFVVRDVLTVARRRSRAGMPARR